MNQCASNLNDATYDLYFKLKLTLSTVSVLNIGGKKIQKLIIKAHFDHAIVFVSFFRFETL